MTAQTPSVLRMMFRTKIIWDRPLENPDWPELLASILPVCMWFLNRYLLAAFFSACLRAQSPTQPIAPATVTNPVICSGDAKNCTTTRAVTLPGLCQWNTATPPVCVPASAPPKSASVTLGPAVPAKLPNIFLIGGSANASTTPKPVGFAAIALPVNQTQQIYSWTSYQTVGVPGRVPTVQTTTGAAMILKSMTFGRVVVDLIGIGAVGAATSATATTSAFNGGGGVTIKAGKWFHPWIGVLQNKAGSTTASLVQIGFWGAF
jgi:hypothetical protein